MKVYQLILNKFHHKEFLCKGLLENDTYGNVIKYWDT